MTLSERATDFIDEAREVFQEAQAMDNSYLPPLH